MKVGPTRRSQHRKAFAESAYPFEGVLRVGVQFCKCGPRSGSWASCPVADVMHLVRKFVLKHRSAFCGIQIQENCRATGEIEDKAVVSRFYDWINTRTNLCG